MEDMSERSSIFDMIGPVMIGPSSSHTAGVVRIGRMTHHILGQVPESVEIIFYNSFATTYEGHGSDRAVIAGLMDFPTDDTRIREAIDVAQSRGMRIKWKAMNSAPKLHPNTLRILAQHQGRTVDVLGVSRGGGLMSIVEIDGFIAQLSGQATTLLVLAQDVPGSIAFITTAIASIQCNVATLFVSRKGKHDDAKLIFELDDPLTAETLAYLRQLKWVKDVVYIPAQALQ
jgi:L-serine dehydratase